MTALHLRCEYRNNPHGIDEVSPRLTWRVVSAERGAKQSAYQILVASSAEQLADGAGDLWDSGKVMEDETANIEYKGKALTSRQLCYWKVGVWDAGGQLTWSKPATWTMGLLKEGDWQANYISFRDTTPVSKDRKELFLPPAHQYRKEFNAAKQVKRATIYATALGIYELTLNGQRVGDAYFAPGWTDYHQRAYYWTYDVTTQVKSGENAIGAWLGDGWYSGYIGFGLLEGIGTEKIGRATYGKTPSLMAQLEIEYVDGTRETIVTDKSWKQTGDGPVREGDFLMGEFYDARKETAGWTQAGFDDSKWESAILASENDSVPATFYEFQNGKKPGDATEIKGRPVDLAFKRPAKLEAFPGEPARITEEIKPVAITSPTDGVHIFNLGQNFANKLSSGRTDDNSGMTTGFIGSRPLLPALSNSGQHDLAVRHFQSRKFPSWGYEVDQGATTIWERWDSFTKEHGFQGKNGKQNAEMNSFSHYAFGAVCEWMFDQLAGIRSAGPGYEKIVIHPMPPSTGSNPEREPIHWVRAHHDSIRGRIASNWRKDAGRFELNVEVPANTSATVFMPCSDSGQLTEGGKPLGEVMGVKLLRTEGDRAVLAVESGSYRFSSPAKD